MKKLIVFDILNNLINHTDKPVYISKSWIDSEGYHDKDLCKQFDNTYKSFQNEIHGARLNFISISDDKIQIFIKDDLPIMKEDEENGKN